MENLLHIQLSEQEAGVLLQLIHVAVQAKGLDAAQAGFHFQTKINSAIAESKKSEPEPDFVTIGPAQPI